MLAPASRIENALVTPRSWGVAAGSREEGDLVYTPFELEAASS